MIKWNEDIGQTTWPEDQKKKEKYLAAVSNKRRGEIITCGFVLLFPQWKKLQVAFSSLLYTKMSCQVDGLPLQIRNISQLTFEHWIEMTAPMLLHSMVHQVISFYRIERKILKELYWNLVMFWREEAGGTWIFFILAKNRGRYSEMLYIKLLIFFSPVFFPILEAQEILKKKFVWYFKTKVISVNILMLIYVYMYNYACITNRVLGYPDSTSTSNILL